MEIAIYQPRVSYYAGGGEVVPLEQAKYLSFLNHKITILTSKTPLGESDYFKNFKKDNPQIQYKYIQVPKKINSFYKIAAGNNQLRWDMESYHAGKQAFEFFNCNKFDIVSLHYLFDVIAIPHQQKSILHLHGYPSHNCYDFEILKSTTNNYCSDSQYILNKWRELIDLPKNIPLTRNGIDSNKFKPIEKSEKKWDAIYLGRLIPIKGIDYLLKALDNLKNNFDFKVAIAGTGPEKQKLKKISQSLGLQKRVEFLGHIPQKNLIKFYNSTKVAIFPSYDKEGILTTMLEAASCATPVITTTACSMKEFLKNNINGLLVKPKNYMAIANALKFIWNNHEKAIHLGKKSRQIIEKKWDWKIKILDVEKAYKNAIKK